MEKDGFTNSGFFKIFLPLLIVAGILILIQRGYAFGQWLHGVLN